MINGVRVALGLTDWVDFGVLVTVLLIAVSLVQWLLDRLVFQPARDRRQARLFDEGRGGAQDGLLVGIHRSVEDIHAVVCEGVKEDERAGAGAR